MEAEKETLLETIKGAGRGFLENDPVGLPDAKDIANIKVILRNYNKARPGEIASFVQQARAIADTTLNDFGATQDKSKRRVLTMPIGLMRQIEEAYPLMFQNRKHLAWFVKNFPAFRTSKRY